MALMWIRKFLFLCLLLFATDSHAEKRVLDANEASCTVPTISVILHRDR
ncbi:hypothetical protein ACO0LF_16375 [Undibacterium sp. Di27W]